MGMGFVVPAGDDGGYRVDGSQVEVREVRAAVVAGLGHVRFEGLARLVDELLLVLGGLL
jgi:hypothetical protein